MELIRLYSLDNEGSKSHRIMKITQYDKRVQEIEK